VIFDRANKLRERALNFVISRSGSDEKSKRSLALLGTWISPCGRNDRKSILFKGLRVSIMQKPGVTLGFWLLHY